MRVSPVYRVATMYDTSADSSRSLFLCALCHASVCLDFLRTLEPSPFSSRSVLYHRWPASLSDPLSLSLSLVVPFSLLSGALLWFIVIERVVPCCSRAAAKWFSTLSRDPFQPLSLALCVYTQTRPLPSRRVALLDTHSSTRIFVRELGSASFYDITSISLLSERTLFLRSNGLKSCSYGWIPRASTSCSKTDAMVLHSRGPIRKLFPSFSFILEEKVKGARKKASTSIRSEWQKKRCQIKK